MEFTSPKCSSALERRNCFYTERVPRSFRVEKLTVKTGTKENCDIREEDSFLVVKYECVCFSEEGSPAFIRFTDNSQPQKA